jgi:hypothetical protein
MTEATSSSDSEQVAGHQRMLGLLLAAAMFVLVVDTSLMNVSWRWASWPASYAGGEPPRLPWRV